MTYEPGEEARHCGRGDVATLVAGFVSGQTLAQIADALGVSVSTVQRRHRDPMVLRAISEARRDSARRVSGQLANLESKAVRGLDELLDDPEPRVRLQAITLVLNASRAQRRAADDMPVPLEHTAGDDPRADQKLSRLMSPAAWKVSPADLEGLFGEAGESTDGASPFQGDDDE
jgi:hypothetical protein